MLRQKSRGKRSAAQLIDSHARRDKINTNENEICSYCGKMGHVQNATLAIQKKNCNTYTVTLQRNLGNIELPLSSNNTTSETVAKHKHFILLMPICCSSLLVWISQNIFKPFINQLCERIRLCSIFCLFICS